MNIDIVKLVIYILVYSFFGWIMESVIKTVVQRKFVNSGFLHGPFCPIYGFGAAIMLIFLYSFKERVILLFIIAFFVLSVWEYIVGWMLEKIFKTKYWDYSNYKINLHGRVCLINSIFWGFLGVVFIKFIHPFIEQKVEIIPNNMLLYIVVVLLFVVIVDLIISIIKVLNIKTKLEKINQLGDTIKEKLEELKHIANNAQINNNEHIQEVIEELKYKQTKIKRKLLKQTNRLKKAFPTMRSETIEKINDYVNQKIENIKKDRSK